MRGAVVPVCVGGVTHTGFTSFVKVVSSGCGVTISSLPNANSCAPAPHTAAAAITTPASTAAALNLFTVAIFLAALDRALPPPSSPEHATVPLPSAPSSSPSDVFA